MPFLCSAYFCNVAYKHDVVVVVPIFVMVLINMMWFKVGAYIYGVPILCAYYPDFIVKEWPTWTFKSEWLGMTNDCFYLRALFRSCQ